MRTRVDQMQQEATQRPPPPAGIHPHLVFRVPLAAKASPQAVVELLGRVGIGVVAIESDNAIIAFRDDTNLQQFRQAVDQYAQGPRVNPQTGELFASTTFDVLEYIESAQMRLWGRPDRIGRRLAESVGDQGQSIERTATYVLDVELWHRGTRTLAEQALDELRRLLADQAAPQGRLFDHFIGDFLCLARVSVTGAKLDQLLNLDSVAELETPPVPVFDVRAARSATPRQFPVPPRPPADGPKVCVVDSGITTNHPLLANNVGHAEAVMTAATSPDDAHGHGTMVGGLAVFGSVRACYESGVFSSPITLYSARVLNDQNLFDDQRLIIHQMRQAIETFYRPPYDCRVFNISLGDSVPWLRDNHRQSLWAESLDVLARELKVILVTSSGNHELGWGNTTRDAEEVLNDYPNFLFQPDCGLCEPATAAIAITVGGITEHDVPSVPSPARDEDMVRVIAAAGAPTPTTRIGPGLNDAIKPEFVAPAGNLTFEGMSSLRSTRDDPGVSVMSLFNRPTERMFAFDVGTSFAAPRVARIAALVWRSLRDYLGEDPHPNLVRAILASASHIPPALRDCILPLRGEDGVRQVAGYGEIDEDLALNSADRRLTLIAQARIAVDTFQIYEVPVPPEFRGAQGEKHVVVSLAFDPPVRRRRAEYLGVEMSATLIRGKTLDEVVEAYRALSVGEREAASRAEQPPQGAFQAPFKCALSPGSRTLAASTLQRSEWTFKREGQDYGDSWFLVVRAQRTWAPDTVTHQDFALAVSLHAHEPQLYNLIQQRVRVRQQQRARARG